MKLSACWIVKNEADNLARSIESLAEIVDELIVVDTGSTDNTVEIAKAFGARTEYFEWISDFSAARNYALSFATGDLVFFLDADEWFVPKLTAADRMLAERLFAANAKVDVARIQRINLDQDTGLMISANTDIRLFRNGPDLCYQGKIHEFAKHRDGTNLLHMDIKQWTLHHSGYSGTGMAGKMNRNIELLEASIKNPDANVDLYMQHCYLVREYNITGKNDEALKHYGYMIGHTDEMLRCCKQYADNFMSLVYAAIQVASVKRNKISRKQLYRALIAPVKKALPNYTGTPALDLYYQLNFDRRDDLLLQQLAPVMKTCAAMTPSPVTFYKSVEAALYAATAMALWRRGKLEAAMEHAVMSLKSEQHPEATALRVLLSCIKGQPAQDIVAFLNSILDMRQKSVLNIVLNCMRTDGFRDPYIYYLKKLIDMDGATKGQFLYLLLLVRQYDESVAAALSMNDEENASVVSDHLFMTAICSGNETVYRDNAQYLSCYATVLDTFFARTVLPNPGQDELRILYEHYGNIAFAAGIEAADQLCALFAAAPQSCFLVKSVYRFNSGLFQEILSMDTTGVNENDYECYDGIIQANLSTKRYDTALAQVRRFLEAGLFHVNLMSQLLVLADCGDPGVNKEACGLRDHYFPLCETIIDLRDTVNTGVIFSEYTPKQQKALKNLTQAQFDKQLAADRALPANEELQALQQRVALLYEEHNQPAMAMQAYRWLIAHGCDTDDNRQGLARAFTTLGNLQVAQKISGMKLPT